MNNTPTYFSTNESDSIVGSNVVVEGLLIANGDLVIEGEVQGNIQAKGGVVVGINAVLKSNIDADTVSVSGRVTGNIKTSGRTTIREMGSVAGNINSEGLTILPGGVFVGQSQLHGYRLEESHLTHKQSIATAKSPIRVRL